MTIQQISVFLENRAGQLAEITKILADNGIDLRALSIAETADYGVLRMIVDDPKRATGILLDSGYVMSLTPVLAVSVPDAPGGLTPVLSLLAEGDIDVEYMYSLFTHVQGKAYMVFRVSDEAKFTALMQQKGMIVAPSKAVNAGGVATSALEMSQNSMRYSWTAEEVDEKLHSIMTNIHNASAKAAEENGLGYNLVAGANLAGFMKVAEAMMAQGLV